MYLLQTPEQGAQTIIHLAVSEETATITNAFFEDCQVGGAPHINVLSISYRNACWLPLSWSTHIISTNTMGFLCYGLHIVVLTGSSLDLMGICRLLKWMATAVHVM